MSNHYHRQSLSLYAEFVLDIILVVQGVKYLPTNARDTRDTSLIPGLGRPPVGGGGNGNTHQYYSLENSMDRGAWWAKDHWVAKSQTCLSTHSLQFKSFNFISA